MVTPSFALIGALCTMLGSLPGIVAFASHGSSAGEAPAEISADSLQAHVEFLASDELAGRSIGSPGLLKAAHYLAAELKDAGLEPAGDEGSFLQAMTFQREAYRAVPELVFEPDQGEPQALQYGSEFRYWRGGESGTMKLHVLGEDAVLPPQPHAGLALCFTELSRSRAQRWLKEQGHENGSGFGAVLTFQRRAGEATDQLPRSGRQRLQPDEGVTPSPAWIELSPELKASLAGGEFKGIEMQPHFELEQTVSYNVLGRLPGAGSESRPELAQQALVVSAHYDHIGTSEVKAEDTEDTDHVYNGADDDASGVATVLEIARALAAEGPQAREVLFLLATAEEIGIVGTSFYLDHPSTPLERTVANLNFEMVGRPDEKVGGPGRLWLSGHERTNLMAAYEEQGLEIGADPYPDQNFFSRSDNIVFCMRGIVGQTFSTYNLHTDYHSVKDEADRIDFEHMQSCARAGLQAVRMVADGSIDPEWLEGGQPSPRSRR
ncbi:MAG: hypothetical protein ACI9F9_001006 [Candidatus Paceibacteria bacterium]|jgi:hypothetical protein